ncbi:hypothetical protein [Streptomyces sp. NPDC058240]|uniref:hypothetical protein n=1 Tax=Streptomyces sp. NPDC058240 TaxID=3346396 RepID=UPI0036E92C56
METRLDDLGEWIRQIRAPPPGKPGHFRGLQHRRQGGRSCLLRRGKSADGKFITSLFTLTSNGTDLAAPREVWTSTGSFNWNTSGLTSGDYNKDGKHDIGVLYRTGTTADGRQIDSLFTFTSTGTDIKAPVKHWTGSVV